MSSACPNEKDELGARWQWKYHDNKDELLELLECREEYFLNWNEIQKSTYVCLKEAICTVLLWISFIWHKCLRLLLTTVSERSWIWWKKTSIFWCYYWVIYSKLRYLLSFFYVFSKIFFWWGRDNEFDMKSKRELEFNKSLTGYSFTFLCIVKRRCIHNVPISSRLQKQLSLSLSLSLSLIVINSDKNFIQHSIFF